MKRWFLGPNHTNETPKRLVLRVITWRVGGVILAILYTWWRLGDPWLGLDIGLTYNAIRVVTHAGHEILWARVRYGLKPSQTSGPAPSEGEHPPSPKH